MSLAKSLLTPERHHHHARHVDRSQQRSERTNKPEKLAEAGRGKLNAGALHVFQRISSFEKKPAKIGIPLDRQPARQHRRESDRHVLPEPTHAPHVLLVMHAMNDRTGTEEQQCFKECVRDDVENRGDKRANAASQKHVTELGDGRVCQNFLDVVLGETDGGGK